MDTNYSRNTENLKRSRVRSTNGDRSRAERVDFEFRSQFSNPRVHDLSENRRTESNFRSVLSRRIESRIDRFFDGPRSRTLNENVRRANAEAFEALRSRTLNDDDRRASDKFFVGSQGRTLNDDVRVPNVGRFENLNRHARLRSLEAEKTRTEGSRSRFSEKDDTEPRRGVRDIRRRNFQNRKLDSIPEFESRSSDSEEAKGAPIFKFGLDYFRSGYDVIFCKFEEIDKYSVMVAVGILLYDAVSVVAQVSR